MNTLANRFAIALDAMRNCEKHRNEKWLAIWSDRLDSMDSLLPSGGGFDAGSKLDRDKSTKERLVFTTSFHHMNEGGFYDGWTEHKVTVSASLIGGLNVAISGRNRNDIKEMIHQSFDYQLRQEFEFSADIAA